MGIRLTLQCLCLMVVTMHSLAAATAQDFGSVAVNGTPVKLTLTYSFSGLSGLPTFALTWARDFQSAAPKCSVTTVANCTVEVTFRPVRPGLRQDAVVVKDGSGRVLEVSNLRGIGLGPLNVLYPGVIATLAGNGTWGYRDASNPTGAAFRNPQGLAVDGSGGVIYVADSVNGVIRKIVVATGAVTTVAGNGSNGYSGDLGPATEAMLNTPTAVAVDGAGNLYIADQGNDRVRKVDGNTQTISTVAGGGTTASGPDGFGDGGPAASAILYGPQSVAVDALGGLYIADCYHNLVRKVDLATGKIAVFTGGGTAAGTDGIGDGGAATGARLGYPSGLALDSAGNLYIADTGNNLIRRVDAASGTISAVAGNGNHGYSGDYGLALSAELESPQSVAIDAANNIYISDYGNNAIRQVSAASGRIVTIAGRGSTGYYGDGGNPTIAFLTSPTGVAVGDNGDVFIADYGNNVIRQVSLSPVPMAFPDQPVGAISPAQVVSPMNVGNQAMTVDGISLSPNFQQITGGPADCAVGAVLSAGASCDIGVGFSPAAAGSFAGTLTLSLATTQTVGLTGRGLGGGGPKVLLSATSLSFGGQLVATASAPHVLTLSNTGATAFNIFNIWVTGTSAGDFPISAACPAALAAGASCTISVSFAPTSSGAKSAVLTIGDSVAGSPHTVALSGTGNGGAVGLSSNSLTFSGAAGLTSGPQTVTFTNNGSFTLHLSGVSISGPNAAEFNLSSNCGVTVAPGSSCNLVFTFSPVAAGTQLATLTISDDANPPNQTISLNGTAAAILGSSGMRFVPVTPCRIADTRNATGAFGGPSLGTGVTRDFVIPSSSCGIPADAKAYSLNFTAVPRATLGYLSVWPTGQPQPVVSVLNSDGRVKANAAIVLAGSVGAISVYSSNPTDLVIDINGYFLPASNLSALGFYPLTPCRVVDTRQTTTLFRGIARDFSPLASSCKIPSTAQAYSMNFTVIPRAPIGFLATWPAGQSRPLVSTLNTSTLAVTANAAIVPAGTNGDITVYSTADTDLVIDINGYFALATVSGALSLFNVNPCRVLDTRLPGKGGMFSGTRVVGIASSSCAVSTLAQAFVTNATVVPPGSLGYLSLWQNGAAWPLSSTLNAGDGTVTSNMAIVPTTDGSVDTLASNVTHLVLDISAYFAP